jgi:cytochrome P450
MMGLVIELSNDPADMANPYPGYAQRRQQAPVQQARTPDGADVWVVTRYEDVRAALADPRLSLCKAHSHGGYRGLSLPPALDANLLNMDPPDHTRLRKLVQKAFTPRQVDDLRSRVEVEVTALLDAVGDRECVDLMADFAIPLPLTVIGDLLGVPQRDRTQFRDWTNALFAPDPDNPGAAKDAIANIYHYLVALIAHRRAEPANDLLSGMIAARDEDDLLTEDELTSLAFLTYWAGYENSVHVIGLGVLALIQHPEQLQLLLDDPGSLPSAVGELLRYANPAQYAIRRFPLRDIEIGGVAIPAGDTVLLCTASANRDPRAFDNPEDLDLSRPHTAHLSFGHGAHFCLGAPLARLEVEVAIGGLLRRFPRLELAVSESDLRWRPSFRAQGLQELPVRLRHVG